MSSAAAEPRCAVTLASPDSPPLALTLQTAGAVRHAIAPQETFRVGATLSMPIVACCQPESLPALSITRDSNRCEPVVEIVTDGVAVAAPPSTRHSTFCTPEVASESETVVVKFVLRQPEAMPGVVFAGLVVSTLTV